MATKLTTCKVCGAEMASSAKSCPKCGAKNKKPIYKKWWLYLLILVAVIAAIAGGSGNSGSKPTPAKPDNTPAEPTIEYVHYNVTDLFDALSDNPLKAQKDFKGQYVELEGFLGTIDSDGKYIGVGANPNDYSYLLQDVLCYIQSDEQLEQIMEMSKDDPIVVRGKITDVGEILGYKLKIDSIN
jgi:RNA polymerase subunit RPABC4/transcription elongation factor Spt4